MNGGNEHGMKRRARVINACAVQATKMIAIRSQPSNNMRKVHHFYKVHILSALAFEASPAELTKFKVVARSG